MIKIEELKFKTLHYLAEEKKLQSMISSKDVVIFPLPFNFLTFSNID